MNDKVYRIGADVALKPTDVADVKFSLAVHPHPIPGRPGPAVSLIQTFDQFGARQISVGLRCGICNKTAKEGDAVIRTVCAEPYALTITHRRCMEGLLEGSPVFDADVSRKKFVDYRSGLLKRYKFVKTVP